MSQPAAPDKRPVNAGLTDEQMIELWRWNFADHTPTEEGASSIRQLRSAASVFAEAIIRLTPRSREQSLALTSLEATLTNSVAAVERNMTNDQQTPDETPEEDKNLGDQKEGVPTNG